MDRAYYSGGALMLAEEASLSRHGATVNIMRSIHDETWKNCNSGLVESVEKHDLDGGKILCIAEAPTLSRMVEEGELAEFLYKSKENVPLKGLKPLAVQHVLRPRRFVVLTEQNLTVYEKRRPLDIFADMLTSEPVERMFGDEPEEMRAMCLALLTKENTPEDVRNRAKEEFCKSRFRGENSVLPNPPRTYSRTYSALYLYASRILRPVWDWSICKPDLKPPVLSHALHTAH